MLRTRRSRQVVGGWGSRRAIAEVLESRRLLAGVSWEQVAKLLPSDGAAGDRFGQSIAVSGNTVVVGSLWDDDNGTESGSAYIFSLETGAQIAKLKPADGAPGDWFGNRVAVDGNTVLVGSRYDDDNGIDSGSAYLFDATTGAQIAKLKPVDGEAGDWFGQWVAISGNTALVGSQNDDDNGDNSGSAYLFNVSTGAQIAKLKPADGAAQDRFGVSVALSGNLALIGSHWDADNGFQAGSAYVFDLTTLSQIAKLKPHDGAAGDLFGGQVSLSGTLALIGSQWDDDNGTDSGSAYLFNATTGAEIAKLKPADGTAGDNFGARVALQNDIALVGSVWDDDSGIDSGSAYLFNVTTGQQIAKLTPADGAAGDFFGISIALKGNTGLVGSFGDANGDESGSMYVFDWVVAWDGGGDGVNWTDPLNWSTDALPGPTDDVYIDVAANPTIQITGTQTVNSLVSQENLTIAGTLSLAAASTLHGTTTLVGTSVSGVLSGAGDIIVTGSLVWSTNGSGSFSVLAGSGDLIIAPGAAASIIGNVQRTALKTIRNAGTITWLDGDVAGLNRLSVSSLINEGNFTIHSNGFADVFGDANSVITNTGTLTFSGTGRSILYPRVNNSGTINAGMPLVETFGPVTSSGTLHVGQGSNLRFSSTTSFSNPGLNISGTGWAIFRNNSHSFNTANTITASVQLETAQLILTAPQTLPALNLAASTLAGSGDVTITGTLNWTGGTMSGSGKTIIAAGGTANLAGGDRTLSRTLRIEGTASWTGGRLFFNSGVIDNRGRFETSGAGVLEASIIGGSVNAFDNTGVFAAGSAYTGFFNIPYNTGGAALTEVTGAFVEMTGGGLHYGDFTIASGSRLNLSRAHTLDTMSSITGAGDLAMFLGPVVVNGSVEIGGRLYLEYFQNPSTYTFNGPVSAGSLLSANQSVFNAAATFGPGASDLTGGTLSGSGDVTITGTLNWTGGTMSGSGKTIIAAGAVGNTNVSSVSLSGRTLENAGQLSLTVPMLVSAGARIRNMLGGVIELSTENQAFPNGGGSNSLVNFGTLRKVGSSGTALGIALDNSGVIEVAAGQLVMTVAPAQYDFNTQALTAGVWRVLGSASFSTNGLAIRVNEATIQLLGTGAIFSDLSTLNRNSGVLALANGTDQAVTPAGGTFTNTGTLNLGAGSVLTVNGNFTQPGGAINLDIAGPNAGSDFGQIVATGAISLNGTLNATLVGVYDPGSTVNFPVVVGASRTGTFSTFTGGPTASGRELRDRYGATTAFVSVRPLAGSAADLSASSDSGVSDTDNLTNVTTPTFTGTASEGVSARIYADGVLVGSGPITAGAWSVTASALADGVRSITATVVDADGDESPASGVLSVTIDTQAPTLNLPGTQTAEATGPSGALVSYPAATAGDDVTTSPQIAYSKASGTVFAIGTTQVTVTATDEAGNVATDTFNVTVQDTTAPTLTVPGNLTIEATGPTGAIVNYGSASATDLVDPNVTITYSIASGSIFPLGTTVVTVTATDDFNNQTVDTFEVTVRDTTAPTLTLPANVTVEIDSSLGLSVMVDYGSAGATDLVDPNVTITYSQASGTSFPLGETVVLVTARDAAGNESTGTFVVRVQDTIAPAAPAAVFGFETRQALELTFGEAILSSLNVAQLVVQNLTTSATFVPTVTVSGLTATLTFAGILPDGDYRLTVPTTAAQDPAGNALAEATMLDFFVLAGDVNRDRSVGFSDLLTLAQNYGQTGRTFSQGNVDYSPDGLVGFSDLLILAQRYGTSLIRTDPKPSVFGSRSIERRGLLEAEEAVIVC